MSDSQLQQTSLTVPTRQMEQLSRGLIAMKVDNGVYVGWRMLGAEPSTVSYNLYRDGSKLNTAPITTSTNFLDCDGTIDSTYSVSAIINGQQQSPSEPVSVWATNYLRVPLQIPAGGTTPDGVSYTYSANDASVGDVDGDGEYEIILKWDPSNSKDNAHKGYTGNVFLDAYKLDGTQLWRIDLGKNIRAGAHYTQFMVYDLDGDGKAEVACKTADGTIDGAGNVIGNQEADFRNENGYVLDGSEYLTIFEGLTGKALITTDYDPPRGKVSDWGDEYGNRVDRFLACVAYLDGVRPSLVMCRGYYTRSVLVAYNYRNGQLMKLWTFDSDNPGNSGYAGQGNHNLSVADVDGDGKDEIIYGSCAIDHDGTGLYTTGLGHGDAMHVGNLDPNRAGFEVFQVHENPSDTGVELHDARTGELLWGVKTTRDAGRGTSADIDPRYEGEEFWAAGGLYNCKGELISSTLPSSTNFAIWWDGDLLRELLDNNRIDKWDYLNSKTDNLLTAAECASNNGTKANPCLQADLFGDWREEVIWRTTDSTALHIYSTSDVTDYRIYTLMHDPVYRLGIAWQNTVYNQPPHTGFYLGQGMDNPPTPNIFLVHGTEKKISNKIYLAGDSTVQTYSADNAPQAGWGQFIANCFGEETQFINRAIGGRSSKTFALEGRLDAILNDIQSNEYLLIQMGHNDSTVSKPERYTEPFTSYKEYLKMYVEGARKQGAIPILITPVARLHMQDDAFVNDFPDYCEAMKQLAAEENVQLIDLMTESLNYFTTIGYEEARSLFMVSVNGTDHTHFTEKGASQIAGLVAKQLKEMNIGSIE
ncbi:MAG: rhamnogalacturonan lyase [Bacilli bacterium]|nr:rhamnogalacturonan lyase [Bacilli bacterium]